MSFPGPSSSDLLNSPEISAQPSRKRQRSQSMQSDSGASNSSVKRTVADNNSCNEIPIRNGREKLFHITQPDDAYMAENLEPDIPFIPASQPSPALSREEKLAFVENGKKVPMEVGDTWYLVARDWYKRWLKALTGEVDKEGPITEQDLGPVDNSSLLDTYSNLLPSLAEGVDVEYVPRVLWDSLVQWYVPSWILFAQFLPNRKQVWPCNPSTAETCYRAGSGKASCPRAFTIATKGLQTRKVVGPN